MKIIATIKHNDPEIEERLGLYIMQDMDGYAILDDMGEDAGQYRWHSEAEARAAMEHLWSAEAWDLQWEI